MKTFDQRETHLSRRQLMRAAAGGALGYSALAGFGNTASAAAQSSFVSEFSDPVDALRAHVKLAGSLAAEDVVSFYRLNIYADVGEGNYMPMFTMNNLLIDKWTPQENNEFQMLKYEAGYYTAMDSYEPLETFTNPVTGEELPVVNFCMGPVPRRYTPDRYFVIGFDPNPLPLEVIGNRVFLATQSIESRPPFGGGDGLSYTNSFMTYSATLADMQNPELASAPVHAQLQNKTEWAEWMGMGDTPGGTIVRGFGSKVANLEELPPGVKEAYSKLVPAMLDTDNWTDFSAEGYQQG